MIALGYPDHITATYYLILAAMLFTIGAVGLLIRRNTLVMFMCVELMLNAVNLTFVSFAKALNDAAGGNVHNLASKLFTDFLWPFEITAVLLVIAVVGSVVLARRSSQAPEQ